VQISSLPDAESHPLWPAIYDLLKPAADFGSVPVEHPDQVVWIAHENGTVFAAATTLLFTDQTAELRLAGGYRHRDWVPQLSETVSAWAKDAGAKKLTMKGRKGWGRYASATGWVALDGTSYEKEL
jgi:hypothetical protein